MKPIRIELTDKKFMNIIPPRTYDGYCILERRQDLIGRSEPLSAVRIPAKDVTRVFVATMLSCGISPGEIIAEVFGKIHDISPEIIEFCMRH